jgi:ATP-dependent exoDNAse (exonuclease V) beta subunit
MHDGKDNQAQPDIDEPSKGKGAKLTSEGMKAIQGSNKAAKENNLQWTAKDGTMYHSYAQQAVDSSIDNVDKNVEVTNNLPVTKTDRYENQKYGIVDTLVEDNGHNTLIDYKTNDMSHWTIEEATRYGNEHGAQVASYIKSPEVPPSTRGYVLAIGKLSSSPEVTKAYEAALKKHGIETFFVGGDGKSEGVVKAVRSAMRKTRAKDK